MVKEIITLHAGQMGIECGQEFWNMLLTEHAISPDGNFIGQADLQINGAHTNFYETSNGRLVPRVVMMDLKCGSLVKLADNAIGRLFLPESLVTGIEAGGKGTGGRNNFAVGYHLEGTQLVEHALELIRQQVELTEHIQGFIMLHSINGGTGSGVGCLMIDKLRDAYKERCVHSYTLFPSPNISDATVEPYNTALALTHMYSASNGTHLTTCFDNEALHSICHGKLNVLNPTLRDINKVISMIIVGATSSMRFPGQLNTDLRKIQHNLVPFARLHFVQPALAPVYIPQLNDKDLFIKVPSISDIIAQIFHPTFVMLSVNPQRGKYFACSTVWRGIVSPRKVEEGMVRYANRNSALFVDTVPDNINIGMCDIGFSGVGLSATFLANSTSFGYLIQRIQKKMTGMYKQKKAYFGWFEDAGCHKDDITEAINSLAEATGDYTNKEQDHLETNEFPGNDDGDNYTEYSQRQFSTMEAGFDETNS